ncbi:CLUMA_CG010676, isoform A [Clunio marinus]|uniref:CLUMA_CG010676, isoform A n=1 Tax=Clunio marinus TaxID=568069 RepID=A0A1J1IFQ1_9DIPT|nr:CLUMA_CG010676, isoform A [Clunio marinus]
MRMNAFPSPHLEHKNLIHHFMNNKSSSSSSSNNHHFHYHLYQYQTHNCCFNLFDPCKTSSTVTTEASNENFSSLPTQSIRNSCQTADFMQSRNTKYDDEDDDKLKTAASSKFTENSSFLKGSGSDNNQSRINEASSPQSNSIEKVIEVKYSNENYKKPEDDQDNCSCTKKYFPYKINEKNVWQVYETSDCKYIQSKYEVDEIFHRPDSSDGNQTPSTCNPLLHSRSNFNNSIICHTINHETEHDESSRENDKNESVNNSTPFDINCTDEKTTSKSKNFDNDDGDYSEADYSSDGTVIEKKRSPKVKSNQSSPKEHSKVRQPSSLVRQENKNVVIPNIHQGWSVTVAGTHPDLAPDVEMKLSFPKAKGATSTPDSKSEKMKQDHPEVFYYKNNQLLPPPVTREIPTQLQYERFEHKPYYNHRRSLSLARIDSGLSGMIKPKSYKLPNLHVPRSTARNAFKVECTTISASKTFIPSRRSMSLDVGNRRLSLDSRSQASPNTSSDLLSVVGSEIKKTLKPKVKTMRICTYQLHYLVSLKDVPQNTCDTVSSKR